MTKKMTSMRLNENLLEQAHKLGLNVTKVRDTLKQAIKRLEQPKQTPYQAADTTPLCIE